MNSTSLEFTSLIKFLLEKRKILFILITTTAIVSTIISYLIPSKYKTIAVVYPIHLSPYSEESQTEQLLQYLNSVAVRDAVIKKMNLLHHYRIDTTKPDYKSLLNYLYRENISISPTLYESIELEVRDKKPEMTKSIAECIIQTADSVILSLKKKIITEEYRNYQKEIYLIQSRIDSINNLIVSVKNEFNILDAKYQSRYLSKKLSNGKLNPETQKIAEAIKNEKEHLHVLKEEVRVQLKSLNNLIIEKNRLEVDMKGDLNFTQVISPPYVPDKKYFPVRWLIVTLSELAVISIFFIYLLSAHKIKK